MPQDFWPMPGDSPEANNARGVFAAMNGDKEAASVLFSQEVHLKLRATITIKQKQLNYIINENK